MPTLIETQALGCFVKMCFRLTTGKGQIEGAFNELAGALKHRGLILSILKSQNAKDGLLIGQAVFKALVKALFNAVG